MNFHKFCVSVAYLVIIASLIYIINYCFMHLKNQRLVVEGLKHGRGSDVKKIAETLETLTIQNSDRLLPGKYKDDYETLLLNLEDYISSLIVTKTIDSSKAFSESEKEDKYDALKDLLDIDQLIRLKDNLGSTMDWITKQSESNEYA